MVSTFTRKTKKHYSFKSIVAMSATAVVLLGLVAASVLANMNQDARQQAAGNNKRSCQNQGGFCQVGGCGNGYVKTQGECGRKNVVCCALSTNPGTPMPSATTAPNPSLAPSPWPSASPVPTLPPNPSAQPSWKPMPSYTPQPSPSWKPVPSFTPQPSPYSGPPNPGNYLD